MFYKNKYLLSLLALLMMSSCYDGIDPINEVEVGPDQESPEVNINFPLEGSLIRVVEDVTTIDIDFEVVDDIEIESISLELDGTEIATLTDFKDYRRVLEEYEYTELSNGSHTLIISATDIVGNTTTEMVNFEKVEPYEPIYDGEIFYMPFDGDFVELVTLQEATVNGSPEFVSDSKAGTASYKGADEAYLTFPSEELMNDEFSAVMWYKLPSQPNRAGILVIDSAPGVTLDSGFRFFREAAGDDQRFKVNAGVNGGNSWFDGGEAADLDPATDADWVHLAFTIADDQLTVYINGEIVSQGDFAGIGWEECETLSIMSGAPNFTHWGHSSGKGQLDELRIFDKALTEAEIDAIISQ